VHRVLAPAGLVVDTQPIPSRPPVDANGARLGTLDMRDWRATINAIEEQVQRVLADGLFTLEVERLLVVTETFDNGPEFVEVVSGWQGTKISQRLARAATGAQPPLEVHQNVRLRVLRSERMRASD
jgi:hypothetical protein